MYQWVSSEIWLILAIISLYIFFKAIDYQSRWNSRRNILIVLSIPVAILQLIISALESIYQTKITDGFLLDILIIYGVIYLLYIYYNGIKK